MEREEKWEVLRTKLKSGVLHSPSTVIEKNKLHIHYYIEQWNVIDCPLVNFSSMCMMDLIFSHACPCVFSAKLQHYFIIGHLEIISLGIFLMDNLIENFYFFALARCKFSNSKFLHFPNAKIASTVKKNIRQACRRHWLV